MPEINLSLLERVRIKLIELLGGATTPMAVEVASSVEGLPTWQKELENKIKEARLGDVIDDILEVCDVEFIDAPETSRHRILLSFKVTERYSPTYKVYLVVNYENKSCTLKSINKYYQDGSRDLKPHSSTNDAGNNIAEKVEKLIQQSNIGSFTNAGQ